MTFLEQLKADIERIQKSTAVPRYALSEECSCQGAKVGRNAYFITDTQAVDKVKTVMCKVYDYSAGITILGALNKL